MKRPDYENAIRLEEQAYGNARRLAAELAVACQPIAHQGDGNCGAVIALVLEALAERGLYVNAPSGPVAQKKKSIGQRLRTQVFERDAYRCKHCGSHQNLRADHIFPESKGGPTTLDNLQTLCQSCNSVKGVKS